MDLRDAGAAAPAADRRDYVVGRWHQGLLSAAATWYEPPHHLALPVDVCRQVLENANRAGWEESPPPARLRAGSAPCPTEVADHLVYVARLANDWCWRYDLGLQVVEPRLLRYTAGQSLPWHTDHNPWVQADPVAKLTVIALISDPERYGGGHLDYSLGEGQERRIPRTRGTVIVWPTTLMHRLSKVLAGERVSIQGKLCGPPLR